MKNIDKDDIVKILGNFIEKQKHDSLSYFVLLVILPFIFMEIMHSTAGKVMFIVAYLALLGILYHKLFKIDAEIKRNKYLFSSYGKTLWETENIMDTIHCEVVRTKNGIEIKEEGVIDEIRRGINSLSIRFRSNSHEIDEAEYFRTEAVKIYVNGEQIDDSYLWSIVKEQTNKVTS